MSVIKDEVTIYTDGGAQPNPGVGGYGVVLMMGSHRKEISGGEPKTTNNRMELTAAIIGLEALTRSCTVNLYSDSKYVVDSIEKGWLQGWQKRNWKKADKKPVENQDLWQKMLPLLESHDVTLHWVKGHAGIPENERCDELANEAIAKIRTQR
jgi:ribonuclease HI